MATQSNALQLESAATATSCSSREANPLAAHAHALAALGVCGVRVHELMHCAAHVGNNVAALQVQAAMVQHTHDELAASTTVAARVGAHGAALHAAHPFPSPLHESGWRLKEHGVQGIALAVNEGAIDRRSEIALPVNRDGGTGVMLGAGAMLNAGCDLCSNVRISKMQWCQEMQAYHVFFKTTRAIAAGGELLLAYEVHGARCGCHAAKLLCPPAAPTDACATLAHPGGTRYATNEGAIYYVCPHCLNTAWDGVL